jgi:hypothetical protein
MSTMRGVFAIGLLLGPALFLAGCGNSLRGTDCSATGSGSKVTKSYNFSEYAGLMLQAANGLDVEVTVGESPSISVTLYENVAEYLDVRLSGPLEGLLGNPTLSLGFTTNLCNTGAKVVIMVTEPLNSVSASSGSINVDRLSDNRVSGGWVSVSGSGSVAIAAVNGTSVAATSTSSGALTVHSIQATLNVDVRSSGSGAVVLGSLTTPTAVIGSFGSGGVTVDSGEATQSVDVNITASGAVTLGNLTTANATISSTGSGSVSGMMSQNLRVQSTGTGAITTYATESFNGFCSGGAVVTVAGGAQVSGSCR